MKLVIAGSRGLNPQVSEIEQYISVNSITGITEIVSGGCGNSPDMSAIGYARLHNIPYKIFKPDWDANGLAAGPMRNREMAEYGDALLLIWDGKSKGSKSMKQAMVMNDKPIYEVIV